MDWTEYKITGYETGVRSLPDYPSDDGYTATQLKAVFDARSDGEIMKQHNALVDALAKQFGRVEVDIADEVETHNGISDAHSELFSEIRTLIEEKLGKEDFETYASGIALILSGKVDWDELDKKVDKEAGKGLSTNDFTDADRDMLLDVVDHKINFLNPHYVTAEQVGAYTKDETNRKFVSQDTYGADIGYYDDQISKNVDSIESNTDRITALESQIGDIEAAFDELHAYAEALIGGDAE